MKKIALLVISVWVASQTFAGFGYYSSVTVNSGQVPSTQTDYPVRIFQTDARFKTVANGGYVQDAQGDDIRPYSDIGITTAITGYQKAFYDGTTGTVEMYVKRGSLADGNVTYLAYGDASLTADGSSSTTWSNGFFRGAHLADGTTLSGAEYVLPGATLTLVNTPTATAGQIDGGAALASASSQYLTNGTTNNPGAAFTISAWVKATSFPNTLNGVNGIGPNIGIFKQLNVKSNGKLYCSLSATATVTYDGTGFPGSHTLSTGTWYHLAMTYNSSAGLIAYVDGVQDGTAAANGAASSTVCCAWYVGLDSNGTTYWNGSIDEPRMASVARSADWITVEYNEGFPSTFETLGAQVTIGATAARSGFQNFFFSN